MKKIIKYAFWVSLGLAPTSGLFAQTNTVIGDSVGGGGSDNSFFGFKAGHSNVSGENNTFIGSESGLSNTTGNKNVFLGWYSGNATTTGYNNLFLGSKTGKDNTTGYRNTFVGPGAGLSNTSGFQNTAIGYLAGRDNLLGTQNVFLGSHAGFTNLGSLNVFLGNQAGYYETGSNKLYIDNSSTSAPLIYGDFSTDEVAVNGNLEVSGDLEVGGDFSVGSELEASSLFLNGSGGVNFGLSEEPIASCMQSKWHFGVARDCGISPRPPGPLPVMTFLYSSSNDASDVGIGTTSPSVKLDVNGEVRATGYITFSDKRLKQDVEPIEDASQLLSELEAVTYTYRQDLKGEGRNLVAGKQIGFIAQDVQKVLPEIVKEDGEGYLGVSYQSLIPLLVESHNELKSENDELRAMLAETQEANQKMEEEIENIKLLLTELAKDVPTSTVQMEGGAKEMLLQNAPNPFSEETTIEYNLNEDCIGAQILITDATGTVIKTVDNLETGRGRIVLRANSLAPGNYRYTLVCQGETLASRTMVIVR